MSTNIVNIKSVSVRWCLYVLTIFTWKNLIQYKNWLKHKIGCFWRFLYVYTANEVLLILLSYRCLKIVIYQVNSKNEWLLLSVTFTAKLGLVFVLTFENAFSKKLSVWEIFSTLTLIQIFWKTKTFFKKLEYHFLVETTKIENTSFSFETALSETNVKTNRMTATKWT